MGRKIYVKEEEMILKRKTTSFEMDTDFVQMYKSMASYINHLKSPWSLKYLIWLMGDMADNNLVQVGVKSFRRYEEFLSADGFKEKEIPSERTLWRVVDELVEQKILLKLDSMAYKVNPAVLWQGQLPERTKQLKGLHEAGIVIRPELQSSVETRVQNVTERTEDYTDSNNNFEAGFDDFWDENPQNFNGNAQEGQASI